MKKFLVIHNYSKACDDKSLVKSITKCFVKNLSDYIIKTGNPVKLPYNFGIVRIMKVNIASRNRDPELRTYYDYNMSKKLGKKIKHTNMSTGGFWWKFCWYKSDMSFTSKMYYKANIVRPLIRNSSYSKDRHRDFTINDFFLNKGWLIYSEMPKSKSELDKIKKWKTKNEN